MRELVGGLTPEATSKTVETFVSGAVLSTDARTENSFRDTNIAFAMLCDINVWELISLANRHPRVNILQPGAGVGGHCIAVDPWFIVHAGGETAKMIKTAREVNTYKTEWAIEKIKNTALLFEKQKLLVFKPDIDDLRESPALYIARRLKADEPNIESHKEFEIIKL